MSPNRRFKTCTVTGSRQNEQETNKWICEQMHLLAGLCVHQYYQPAPSEANELLQKSFEAHEAARARGMMTLKAFQGGTD